MFVTHQQKGFAKRGERIPQVQVHVEKRVRERLGAGHPYCFYFRDVTFDFEDGVLSLYGRLPTFYLKQVLQTLLRDIDGVEQIDNQVDVVSSTGLSSVRPR